MSQLTTMLHTYITAQANTGGGNGTGTSKGKWKTNDNDLPNGQRSKRRHPTSDSYCFSCGYDLPPKHDSKTCKWKKEGHKDSATIKNKMGGSERNCFHHK
jgi:hypothetical protein